MNRTETKLNTLSNSELQALIKNLCQVTDGELLICPGGPQDPCESFIIETNRGTWKLRDGNAKYDVEDDIISCEYCGVLYCGDHKSQLHMVSEKTYDNVCGNRYYCKKCIDIKKFNTPGDVVPADTMVTHQIE